LVGEIAERLLQILKEIARDYRIQIMEVMPDYVHMVIEAPNTCLQSSFTSAPY
jgi:REP element-mobilizing transposase RayT